MEKKKQSKLKKKSTIVAFAVIALVAGAIFLDQGKFSITSNTIISNQLSSPINFIPLIGLALVICSGILSAYLIFKR